MQTKRQVNVLKALSMLAVLLMLHGCGTSTGSSPSAFSDLINSGVTQSSFTETITDGRASIQTMLADSKSPSATVALIDGDRIAWSEAFGYIDKAGKVAPTTSTMFAIGSTSKLFAGLAVMKLVDQGKVELDKPLVNYVKSFSMTSPEYTQVTVRMLINHTAGFPGGDYRNDVTYAPVPDFASQVMQTLSGQRLKYTPGKMAIYSNDGFTMVDPLVKAVSGKSYQQFVTDEILTPLEMTHSRYATEFFPTGSYAPRFSGDKADPQVFTNTYPAGGLYSTPEDMGHVAMMLMDGGLYNGVQVLSRKSVEEIGKDQTLSLPVNPVNSENYGLGWDWVSYPGLSAVGVKAWSKPGGTAGYSTQFIVAPDARLAVAITGVSMSFNSGQLAERIMLHALAEKGIIEKVPTPLADVVRQEKPATDAELAAMAGYYADNHGINLVEVQSDRTLKISYWIAGNWTTAATGLKLRVDGTYSSDNNPNTAYRTVQSGGMTFLAKNMPVYTGHYLWDSISGQRVEPGSAISAAWKARLNKHWLITNESSDSIHLIDDTPRMTLNAVDGMSGYVFVTAVFPISQMVDPSQSDTVAKMFLQIPMTGRDMNDAVVQTRNGEEWMKYGSALFRPQDTVPDITTGQNKITIGSEGLAEWRRIPSAASVTILGDNAWKMYDPDFKKQTGSGTGGTATPSAAGSYLLLYGLPNATITVTQGAAQ